jgi:hypothetical protein
LRGAILKVIEGFFITISTGLSPTSSLESFPVLSARETIPEWDVKYPEGSKRSRETSSTPWLSDLMVLYSDKIVVAEKLGRRSS